jgi:alkylation response protein AidB-like acyl-CoA dehydrogenase
MHNLELNEDQTMLLDTVRRFVADSVRKRTLELDEHRQFDREGFTGLGGLGLFGLPVSGEHGGAGMGMLAFAIAAEEIASGSGSLARLFSVQAGPCAKALEASGADADLAAVVSGDRVAAFVGREHGVSAADGKLTGKAELVTGAGEAGLLLVVARDGRNLVLHAVDPAACQRTPARSLGFASTAPARIEFAGTPGRLLADGEIAASAVRQAEAAAWIGSAAIAVGLAGASVQASHKHAGERIAFGKPLLQQQAVARKLVEARRLMEAARHLVFHAGRLWDLGQDARQAAIAARLTAVEAAVQAGDDGIQVHGGYGYTVEYHVERHYRDAMTLEVLDGGAEALREELARAQFAG